MDINILTKQINFKADVLAVVNNYLNIWDDEDPETLIDLLGEVHKEIKELVKKERENLIGK